MKYEYLTVDMLSSNERAVTHQRKLRQAEGWKLAWLDRSAGQTFLVFRRETMEVTA